MQESKEEWPKTRRSENKVRATWLQRGGTVLFVVPDLCEKRCRNLAESVPSDCHVLFAELPLTGNKANDVLFDFFNRCRLLKRKSAGLNSDKKTGLLLFGDGCVESKHWSPKLSMALNQIGQKHGAQIETVHPRKKNRAIRSKEEERPADLLEKLSKVGPVPRCSLKVSLVLGS